MKSFKSVGNYITESIGERREIVYVVENDIDRNNIEQNDRWLDLFPEIEIDGIQYITRSIKGETPGYAEPRHLTIGAKVGICILKKNK